MALQSWALWVARAMGLAFTSYATDGARVSDVVDEQISAALWRNARRDPRYDLGCLYVGVNDVRSLDWDATAYRTGFRSVIEFLTHRCDRTVALTLPVDLGRPRAGPKVEEANAIIEAEAPRARALVVDLRGFRGRRIVMADHVHPTALGQVAIAERVAEALAVDGLKRFASPSQLVEYETTWWKRLRGDAT